MDMSVYGDRHAELYDRFHADKAYCVEAAFVSSLVQRHAPACRRILDVACGTGTHAVELARLGYSVVGVDQSADMIARGREKAADLDISFVESDMRDLPDLGPFDAVVCLFDSIGYATTNDGVLSTLRGIRRNVDIGAPLVVEYWHAVPMLQSYEPVRVRRLPIDGGEVVRISETSLRIEEQLSEVRYSIYELRDDGTWSSLEETHLNRWFLVQEMAALLGAAGFDVASVHGGYADVPVDESAWHVVCAAVAS